MKRNFLKSSFLALLIVAVALPSCKKDKPVEPNEEEVITTMQLTFIPVGGGTTLTYKFDDADGPGGENPVQDQILLSPATTYNVSVQLLNKTETPVGDITAEVQEENMAHRFYYEPSAGSNILVSGLNNDDNGIPLGITSSWTTGAVSTGEIKITLRHYGGNPPNKATGDAINSIKSSTDIDVTFVTAIL